MPRGYFSTKRDNELIASGGFFCWACLVGKPATEKSLDIRYCQGCYEVLLKEAEALTDTGRRTASWKPIKPGCGAVSSGGRALPVEESAVTKIADKETPTPLIMLHPEQRGRPIKSGEVTRQTVWRRAKDKEDRISLGN